MKLLIFSLILFSQNLFAQSIVCGSQSCIPNNVSAVVQEKATYSAIDLGFNSGDISVLSGTGTSTREVRLNLQNGEAPGHNLSIDLSSNQKNKNSGDIFVFADNINSLNVKLNGYNGQAGKNASEICADRVLSGTYGNDIKQRFLQRRADIGTQLVMTKCSQVDIDDIQSSTFACTDPSFVALSQNDPKVSLTRVRKISKCQSILPQKVCLQKFFQVSCSFKMQLTQNLIEGVVNSGSNGEPIFFEDLMNKLKYGGPVSCSQTNACPSFPLCYNRVILTKNGSTILDNYFTHYESDMASSYNSFMSSSTPSFNKSKIYSLSEKDIADKNALASQNGINLCQQLINDDSFLSSLSNSYTVEMVNQNKVGTYSCGAFGSNCSNGCNFDSANMRRRNVNSSSQVKWVSVSNPVISETSPGLDSTGLRLEGGSSFLSSINGNNAMNQSSSSNWQLELMPALYPSCNVGFKSIGTETSNVIKSLFDPNLFTNGSSYCLNVNDPTNCSAPPFCDNPSDQTNCRKVSACEQINKKYCLNPLDQTNCSSPPFCDDPSNTTNCSSVPYSKSCDPADPTNSFCEKDPYNLGSYQLIGTEPDPSKTTETYNCRTTNCQAQYQVVESSQSLDTIQPLNGESGTSQGRGLFFVYDIKTILQSQANSGQAGNGGRNDLSIPTEVRYCAVKRDFTTDPNTQYENDPNVIFKKINWKSLDIKSGGNPGTYPDYSDKKIEIYKKIDPGIRYILKKELL